MRPAKMDHAPVRQTLPILAPNDVDRSDHPMRVEHNDNAPAGQEHEI